MQPWRDPRRLDLPEHLLQRPDPVLVPVLQLIRPYSAISRIALRALDQSRVVDQHHAESALLRERDVLVHVLRANLPRPVYRCVHLRLPPALHPERQAASALHRIKAREERWRLGRDDRRRSPHELQVAIRIRREQVEAMPPLAVRHRHRAGTYYCGCGGAVPHHVQPVAEVGAVLHRQLHKAKALHRRRRHPQSTVVGWLHYEPGKLEQQVVRRLAHLHARLVRGNLESHDQLIPLPAHAVGRIGRLRIRVGELDLVVERPVLRHREKRQLLGRVHALHPGRLHDERLHHGVIADREPHAGILQHHIAAKRAGRERRRQRKHALMHNFSPHLIAYYTISRFRFTPPRLGWREMRWRLAVRPSAESAS